jgi:hypothetical protein
LNFAEPRTDNEEPNETEPKTDKFVDKNASFLPSEPIDSDEPMRIHDLKDNELPIIQLSNKLMPPLAPPKLTLALTDKELPHTICPIADKLETEPQRASPAIEHVEPIRK